MAEVLIRGVPDDVAGALDAKASRLGISRTEYLRREVTRPGDTELMRRAWE